MVSPEIIRNYEVSIWTLQDSFITVLKQSNLENMGKIQEPKITLKDDGENTFSFKIPMYILQDGDWIENPIWYTTYNGNIIANMRKVKVIFNKQTEFEKVLEFIIVKVTEEHEGRTKFCSVECEGLAFHELGKQGYNITLSSDIAQLDYEAWLNGELEQEPILNIDYWVKKVLKNTNWEYLVCMDWSSQDGALMFENSNNEMELIDNIKYINDEDYRAEVDSYRDTNNLRSKQKIYREPYVSAWNITNGNLTAAAETTDLDELEFKTCIEGSESNRYNLLQSIAEAFKVFCKFVYEYDDNYHIIGRKVIFYNNFIGESGEILDFNYGYNTQDISREMDSNDLVTKMYVKPLKDAGVLTGEIYLSDSDANKTLENYLMNFDYLYDIGTITQEQYDEIAAYNVKIRELNEVINEKTLELNFKEAQLPQIQARKKTAEDSLQQDAARLAEADDYLRGIAGDSVTQYTTNNPYLFVIMHGANLYYSEISFKGIKRKTLKLYSDATCTTEIEDYNIEEKDGNIVRIKYTNSASVSSLTNVWATFEYDLSSPYKIIQQMYSNKQQKDSKDFKAASDEEKSFISAIDALNNSIKEKTQEKEELIASFERIMGPALREGTWQPDKGYENYQENKTYNTTNSLLNIPITNSGATASFIWDRQSFEEENKNYYNYGVDGLTLYYPCLKLDSEMLRNLTKEDLSNIFLVYEDNYGVLSDGDPRATHYLQLNTDDGCRYAFLKRKDDSTSFPIPVLMITGVLSFLPEEEDENIIDLVEKRADAKYRADEKIKNKARISRVTGYNERQNTIIEQELIVPTDNKWIPIKDLEKYEVVFPRFQINNKFFVQNTPEQKISRVKNGQKEFLKENEDYYTLYRDQNWYITLKTETILESLDATYSLHYTLSTAANAMYLDALDIMKENAFPKTSYNITPLAINKEFMRNAYDHLGQLAHINDDELKFENVQGYISEVDLDLDKPWEDTYVIKNYKTKFEDVFSSIVAQTEQMKKNSTVIGMAANLITSEGMLEKENLMKSLLSGDIQSIIENFSASKNSIVDLRSENASSDDLINKIINGEQGLNFGASSTIERVILNNQNGLIIQGKVAGVSSWFQVSQNKMGFYHLNANNEEKADLYYNSGNLTLSGHINAKGGSIGGWEIDSDNIHRNTSGTQYTQIGGSSYAIFAGATSPANASFSVTYEGTLKAIKGNIGGWTIDANSIFTGTNSSIILSSADFSRAINGTSRVALRMAFGTKFGVASDGALYASGATISGAITATSGTFTGTINANDGKIGSTATNQIILGDGIIRQGKASLTDANNGFFISKDGLALGPNSKFKVTSTGAVTASDMTISGGSLNINNTFSVTTAGAVTASNITITGGSLNINDNFKVTSGGVMSATGATISGNITANNLYLKNGSGGTTDVAGTLSKLLLQAEAAEDDAAEEADQKTIIITGYGSNYLKLLRSDGKKKTINFKTATDVTNAYNSGYKKGKTDGAAGVSVNSVTLGSKVTGAQYNCTCSLSNGESKSSTINVTSAYKDAREGYTRGDFYVTSDTFYVQNGPSSYTRYTGTLYKKR